MFRNKAAAVWRAVGVAVIASGAGVSAPALAEERSIGIEEVIVTARKREESAQEVPVAITALTQEVQDASVRDLTDLNAYLPNVIIEDNAQRARGSAINIRGIAYSETDKSFDPPIAVVLDGVFIGTNSGQVIENFDLERIEVLRGPQGTLFGKNTVGGVINVIRTRPTGELGAKLQLTGGEWDQREVRAVVNLPQVGDMLSTKLFYSLIKSDGHLKNVTTGKDAPKKDYQNFGATLLFEPSDRFDALLTVEAFRDDSDVAAPRNANDPGYFLCDVLGSCRTSDIPDDQVEGQQPNTGKFETDAISLTMRYDLNDNIQLVSVTGWRDEIEDYISEYDGSALPYIWIDNDNTHEQFSQEIRFEGTYDKFNFVLGGYFWDSNYTQNWVTFGSFWQTVVPGLDVNEPVAPGLGLTDLCLLELVGALRCDQSVGLGSAGLGDNFTQLLFQEQDVNSQAVFFQADYNITEKWTVTAGLRWTREEKEFVGAQSYLAPLERAGLPVEEWAINAAGQPDLGEFDLTYKETSPKVGLSYQMTDDVMFYASYSEGFHSGGFFGRNQNAKDFANTYEPEFANSWELGMKSQFFDNRVQLNVAGFYNDFEGKQEATVKIDASTNTVVTVIDNVGNVEYLGLEAEMRWVITENFNMFASLGILDAEYKDFCIDIDGAQPDANPTSDCGEVTQAGVAVDGSPLWLAPQDRTDLTPKSAPEFTFGIGGTYTIPIGPGSLDIHARYNHVDEFETDLGNAPGTQAKAVDILNASASYGWDRYRLTVYGRNLTDEQREVEFPIPPYFNRSYLEPGRSWGIEFLAEFGGG
jgi:iron complex outermembrane receptor protein